VDDQTTTRVLTIEGLGFGAEGYVRCEEGFVSIHHTLPGDVVVAKVGEFKRGRAWGEVIKWKSKGGDHVEPDCHHYTTCSGCSLRHVDRTYESQWKLQEAAKIIDKYGPPGASSVEVEWLGPERRVAHRLRGRFRIERGEPAFAVGLRSVGLGGDLVNIPDCPAQLPAFQLAVSLFFPVLESESDIASIEVRLASPSAQAEGSLVLLESPQISASGAEAIRELSRKLGCSCARVWEGELGEVFAGSPSTVVTHSRVFADERDGLPAFVNVEAPWSSWYHANAGAARALFDWVAPQVDERHISMIDLCAGIGGLSMSVLRPGLEVLAVDQDRHALNALSSACSALSIGGVSVRPGKVGTVLRRVVRDPHGARPTLATINPMRQPLGKELSQLGELPITQVFYLGPSPSSAAKDWSVLAQQGFRLARIGLADLHPATAQFMLVAMLRRP